MPTFDYKCDECDNIWEEFEIPWAKEEEEDPKSIHCPECGSLYVTKLIGAPSAHFKGQGFYETDYKRGGKEHKE